MSHTLISGPHTLANSSVAKTMLWVIVALSPATLWGIYSFGWPALNLLLISAISALAFEALCLWLAGRPFSRALGDNSALLTAWLLALSLPPWSPWWLAVCGSFFAIVVAKQVFGGIGQNVFNPAMVARVALLVSFPLQMTSWALPAPLGSEQAPDFMQSLAITFAAADLDGYTGATLLGEIKTELGNGRTLDSLLGGHTLLPLGLGQVAGSFGETSALLLLAGGLLLLALRIIPWTIPVSLLASLAVLAFGFHHYDPQHYLPPMYHLLSGATLMTAFFIATDMVTSPNTALGQCLFGAGCGLLMYLIRSWGGYPEGAAFAVLIMNAMTPLIDHLIRPRIFGRDQRGRALRVAQPEGAQS